MSSTPVNVLIAGDCNGKLSALFKRVAAVNKSNGPFHVLFCVGGFFPTSGAVGFFWAQSSTSARTPPSPGDHYLSAPISAPLHSALVPCRFTDALPPAHQTHRGMPAMTHANSLNGFLKGSRRLFQHTSLGHLVR